jgi:hypothetical protein
MKEMIFLLKSGAYSGINDSLKSNLKLCFEEKSMDNISFLYL